MTKRLPDGCKKIADKGSSEIFLRTHVDHDSDECLLWPYKTNAKGYGLAVINGVQKPASRWMCILAHGEPPSERHQAAHNCGNPKCVNPRHLRWDTHAGNQADRNKHGTHNRGERNGKTELSEHDIRMIRNSPPNLKTLMKRYGVSKGCISKIRSRQRWGHVE